MSIDVAEMDSPLIPCRPPWYARGGHAQTLWGHCLPSAGIPLANAGPGVEEFSASLGGDDRLLGLCCDEPGVVAVVHLFHGLGGDSGSDYMRRTAAVARALGCAVVAWNARGCGAGRALAEGMHHAGRSDDFAAAIAAGRKRWPRLAHIAVGFSLSGNALLLLDARRPDAAADAHISVNPPVDLADCAERLRRGACRIYEVRFVARCRAVVSSLRASGQLEDGQDVDWRASLREFDERITALHAGYRGAEEYYQECSALPRLAELRTPTVLLHALDDPMAGAEVLVRAPRSKSVHLHLEPSGGHMGYLGRLATPFGARRWLDYALDHYLRSLLERLGAKNL